MGVWAQVQHVLGYAGVEFPEEELVDPRFRPRGSLCEDWFELGEKWAPASDYGTKIEEIAQRFYA